MTIVANLCRIWILCFFMFCITGCGPMPIQDLAEDTRLVQSDDGVWVEIPRHPHRMITLSSALDTTLLGLVDPKDMLAINALVRYEGYSLEADKAKQFAIQMRSYSAEKIIKLKPDLVIVPEYTTKDIVDSLRGMGIPTVVVTTGKTVEEVLFMIQRIADIAGVPDKGKVHIATIQKELEWIREVVSRIPTDQRKSVLFVSSMDGYTGTNSFFEDMCTYMGMDNAPTKKGYPPRTSFTDERVIDMNPDYILIPSYEGMDKGLSDRFLLTSAFQSLKAMKEGHVVPLKAAYLYTANHHIGEAMVAIVKTVYPEYVKE